MRFLMLNYHRLRAVSIKITSAAWINYQVILIISYTHNVMKFEEIYTQTENFRDVTFTFQHESRLPHDRLTSFILLRRTAWKPHCTAWELFLARICNAQLGFRLLLWAVSASPAIVGACLGRVNNLWRKFVAQFIEFTNGWCMEKV